MLSDRIKSPNTTEGGKMYQMIKEGALSSETGPMFEFSSLEGLTFGRISAMEGYKLSGELKRTIDAHGKDFRGHLGIEVFPFDIEPVKAFCDWVNRKPGRFKDLGGVALAYEYGVEIEANGFREAMTTTFVLHCESNLKGLGKAISNEEIKTVYSATEPKSPLRSILVDHFITQTKKVASREFPNEFLIDLAMSVKGKINRELDPFHHNSHVRKVLGDFKT